MEGVCAVVGGTEVRALLNFRAQSADSFVAGPDYADLRVFS
jgi:hypothetical protein